MACKMKKTHTRTEQECMRKENGRMAWEMKGKKVEKTGKSGKDKAEVEKIKRLRRGLKTLKEI